MNLILCLDRLPELNDELFIDEIETETETESYSPNNDSSVGKSTSSSHDLNSLMEVHQSAEMRAKRYQKRCEIFSNRLNAVKRSARAMEKNTKKMKFGQIAHSTPNTSFADHMEYFNSFDHYIQDYEKFKAESDSDMFHERIDRTMNKLVHIKDDIRVRFQKEIDANTDLKKRNLELENGLCSTKDILNMTQEHMYELYKDRIAMMNNLLNLRGPFQVFVRLRPILPNEHSIAAVKWECEDSRMLTICEFKIGLL